MENNNEATLEVAKESWMNRIKTSSLESLKQLQTVFTFWYTDDTAKNRRFLLREIAAEISSRELDTVNNAFIPGYQARLTS